MADFEPSRNQNPELILTKLGMADYDYDCVRDPAPYITTLVRVAQRGWSGQMCDLSYTRVSFLFISACFATCSGMGVDHGGTSPPEFGAGDANANCPPRFCHIGTKMSVLWPSKYAKIRFRPHDAPPDPLVGWRGDTPSHMPPHSARTHLRRSPCVPPEVQPDLRLCAQVTFLTDRDYLHALLHNPPSKVFVNITDEIRN